MAESNDIPNGTYSLTLGKSFDPPAKGRKNEAKPAQFHTLRYDFKPSSVSADSETYIAFGNSGDVHVAVPNEADQMTVFKGSKKEAKPKECLLFFDKKTGTVRLEKITSQINVKKTRDLDAGTDAALRRGIERLRTTTTSPPPPPMEKAEKSGGGQKSNKNLPVSSDSSSDSEEEESSDSDKSNSSDDDESALLEQMKQPTSSASAPAPAPAPQSHYQHHHHHQEPVYNTAPPVYKPPTTSSSNSHSHSNSNRDKGDSAKYGLALSESSEEDD